MQQHYPLNPATGLEDPSQLPWINGNPATGAEGSFPPFALCTDPMDEIINVITGADLVPAGDLTQLLQAIKILIPLYAPKPAAPVASITYGPGEGLRLDAGNNFDWNLPGLTAENTIADGDLVGFYQSAAEDQPAGHHYQTSFATFAAAVLAKQASGIANLGAYIALQVYTASQTVALDPNCQAFTAALWGAGAGGQCGSGAAGGGGGGEFALGSYQCPKGSSLALLLGGMGSPGNDGGASSVTLVNYGTLVSANGGQRGGASGANTGGAGGTGGTGGQVHIAGQPGQAGLSEGLYFPGPGGGSFGCGTNTTTGNVINGVAPGQGGTGCNPITNILNGGQGGPSQIILAQLIGG